MPGSRPERARKPARDDALGTTWATAVQNGAPLQDVAADIRATAGDRAPAGVRALGARGGEAVIPLLEHLVRTEAPGLAAAATDALGDIRSTRAADALEQLAREVADRALQKAARRSLYRLASQGIHPATDSAPVTATIGSRDATLYRAVASAYDGTGSRE